MPSNELVHHARKRTGIIARYWHSFGTWKGMPARQNLITGKVSYLAHWKSQSGGTWFLATWSGRTVLDA